MLIKNYLLASGVLVFISLTSGCVTYKPMSPQQCQASNWHAIGVADGSVGRSGAYYGKYVKECNGVVSSRPNRVLWEQGRQEGLKKYCTELNAYKLGRQGYAWQPVCPLEGIEKLEEAYQKGRYYYLRQQDLDYLSMPWGFGNPYRYGWHHPFWRP